MKQYLIATLLVLHALLSLPTAASASTPTPTLDAQGVDLTNLPLGDSRHSTGPQVGYIWPCHIETNSKAGAGVDGPWINKTAGTYNLTAKDMVHGSVEW